LRGERLFFDFVEYSSSSSSSTLTAERITILRAKREYPRSGRETLLRLCRVFFFDFVEYFLRTGQAELAKDFLFHGTFARYNGNINLTTLLTPHSTSTKATQELVTKVPQATKAELEEAVATAEEAFQSWKKTTVLTRQKYIFDLRHLIVENMVGL
jgi:hypothetical protein